MSRLAAELPWTLNGVSKALIHCPSLAAALQRQMAHQGNFVHACDSTCRCWCALVAASEGPSFSWLLIVCGVEAHQREPACCRSERRGSPSLRKTGASHRHPRTPWGVIASGKAQLCKCHDRTRFHPLKPELRNLRIDDGPIRPKDRPFKAAQIERISGRLQANRAAISSVLDF